MVVEVPNDLVRRRQSTFLFENPGEEAIALLMQSALGASPNGRRRRRYLALLFYKELLDPPSEQCWEIHDEHKRTKTCSSAALGCRTTACESGLIKAIEYSKLCSESGGLINFEFSRQQFN
jgi:hypothetical protein